MKTENYLAQLETLVMESNTIPLSNKRIIDEDEIMRITDDMKVSLQFELSEAQQLVEGKDKILADAHRQADALIAQAKEYIAKLTEEHELVKAAQEQAAKVIAEASKSSAALEESSVNYAEIIFKYVENNLEKTLEALRENRVNLKNVNQKK